MGVQYITIGGIVYVHSTVGTVHVYAHLTIVWMTCMLLGDTTGRCAGDTPLQGHV